MTHTDGFLPPTASGYQKKASKAWHGDDGDEGHKDRPPNGKPQLLAPLRPDSDRNPASADLAIERAEADTNIPGEEGSGGGEKASRLATGAEVKGETEKKAGGILPTQTPQAASPDRRRAHIVVPFWKRTNRSRADGARKEDTALEGSSGAASAKRDLTGVACRAGATPGASGEGGGGVKSNSKRLRTDGKVGGNNSSNERPNKTSAVRYQFRAGYTNAVRRPVRMRDLL